MGFRFRKSVNIGPIRLNYSKSGIGYSIGAKGYRVTKKASGGYRKTTSVPGTGISYVEDIPKRKNKVNYTNTESFSVSDQQPVSNVKQQSESNKKEPIINTSDNKIVVNKHVFVWVCNLLCGGLGVDRFIRGQIGLGIFKLLIGSWITLGIWPLVDFTISIVKSYGNYADTNEVTFINGKYSR
ncbi:TM2 domain [Fructobacillus cardui]|nr:TM2 domain [Fructobacillus cardui]